MSHFGVGLIPEHTKYFRNSPYNIFLRHLGIHTTRYRHSVLYEFWRGHYVNDISVASDPDVERFFYYTATVHPDF